MFGKRRQKPEDDESLVPHGMIWYATPEVENDKPVLVSEAASEEVSQPAVQPAPVLKMPPRPVMSEQVTQELKPAVNSAAPVFAATCHPVVPSPVVSPSRSHNLELLTRKAPKNRITAPPSPVTEITAVIDLNEPEPPSKAEFVSLRLQRRMAWLNTRINKTAGSASDWISRTTLSAWSNARRFYFSLSQSVDLKKEFARGRQYAQNWAGSTASATRRYSQATQALRRSWRDALTVANRFTGKSRQAFLQATTSASQRASAWKHHSVPRARIVLSRLRLRLRIFFARQITRWSLRIESRGADARLLTSMTLAAISAIIALVIVSLAPHYATRYLPSRIPPTTPTVNASTQSVLPAANIIVRPSLNEASETAPLPVKPISSPAKASLKRTTAIKPAAAKRHRGVDDDYIAPDTYKYYGNGQQARVEPE